MPEFLRATIDVLLGIGLLFGGGELFVQGSVALALVFGIPQLVIGLTVVAIGTGAPELVTSVVASARGQSDIAIANVVGSNIFNILAIMGVAAAVSPAPVDVPGGFISLDLPVMLASALGISVFVWLRRPIGRVAGVLFVAAYLAYLVALVLRTLVTV